MHSSAQVAFYFLCIGLCAVQAHRANYWYPAQHGSYYAFPARPYYAYQYQARPHVYSHHNPHTTQYTKMAMPEEAPIDVRTAPNTCPKNGDVEKTVATVATEAGTFGSLLDFVTRLDMVEAVEKEECKTVLAPPDSVFAQLPEGALDGLIESGEGLKILVKHVINQCITSDEIQDGPVVTAGGEFIEFTKLADGKVQIKSGEGVYNVTAADIPARCGVIHVVDGIFV